MADKVEIDYDKLAEAQAKANKKAGVGSDSGGKSVLDKLTAPVEALGDGFKKVATYVTDSADTFTKLSQTGNSFNNDMIGLKVAAANARVSTEDFAGVLATSGKSFSGLGGNVAKGGQVFGEFSKTFFDSGLTENLRQMGYTSKDLNEVLAMQIGFQKSSSDTSREGQIKAAAAAADLAMEMDLIAKQTGKTRKEQEAALEKAKADGQIEAKMRLIGLQQGAEAEKAAREGFAKQLAQAEAMGTGQAFKEVFATGTVRSQEAALQVGLLGDAARETMNSARSLSKGNVEEAQAASDRAKVANLQNQSNQALLSITASGVGPAADAMKKNIETNDTLYHGSKKTADATGNTLKTQQDFSRAVDDNRKTIVAEQQARHGATAAYIASTARLQDLTAAGANKIKPLNEGEANRQLLDLANKNSQGVRGTDTARQTADSYRQALINQAQMGGADKAPASSREKYEKVAGDLGVDKAVGIADKTIGGTIQGGAKIVDKVTNFVSDTIKVRDANIENAKINGGQNRDEGTLGKTGQPFEPQDFFGKVQKGEMVLTPEQAQKFMAGAKTDGMTSAVNDLAKSMPKLDMSMFKDMQTQVTSASGEMPTNMQAMQGQMQSAMSKMQESMPSNMQAMQERMKAEMAKMDAAAQGPVSIKDIQANMAKGMSQEDAQKAAEAKAAKPASIAQPFDKSKIQMPSMGQISFGPDGMPRIAPKAQAQTIPAAVDKKNEDKTRKTEAEKPTDPNAKTTTEGTTPQSKDAAGAKTATQDESTKLLSSLNTTMNKVHTAITEMNTKLSQQVKATKAMSGNAFDRA